jgi:DNA-binding transcriptional regulator YdaS (Cro superfamily)
MLLVLTWNTLGVHSGGMDAQPAFDLPSVGAAVARAIALTQTQQKLAAACGVSQAAISKAKIGGRVSPRLALAIHRATGGAVPASVLRPDLWRRPADVPVEGASRDTAPSIATEVGRHDA